METAFCFGTEQEHPPVTLRDDGKLQSTDNITVFLRLQQAIRNSGVPYIGDEGGLFTPYGRFYFEGVGKHVEIGVIPSGSPDHAVKNELRFTRVLQNALRTVRKMTPGLNLLKNNVDYITRSTWASHESYASTRRPEELKEALLPFLITRQIYAGSGTIMGGGMRLSPRAMFMCRESGGDTTRERAIFSTCRDEPLMNSSTFQSRLHLIVGDGLMSQFGQWLKLGVTALVVKAAELDPSLGDSVKFEAPVTAIKTLTRLDPMGAQLFDKTLLAVQQHYLHAVNRMLDRYSFPEWCGEVVLAWADVLEMLEQDPRALGDRLDPYIKIRLFEEYLHASNKSWNDVATYSDIYFRLAVLDVRYHALLDGMFEALDQAGVLSHRRIDEREVEPGSEPEPFIPEAVPREVVRARVIKTNSGQSTYWCDWKVVVDRRNHRLLLLEDPLSGEASWEYSQHASSFGGYGERLREELLRAALEAAGDEEIGQDEEILIPEDTSL